MELIVLDGLILKTSTIDDEKFKQYVEKEHTKNNNKKYDLNYRLRDLYPLTIHTQNKKVEDVKIFFELNDFILEQTNRITRRITKKEIVYKKDKSKSIINIRITQKSHVNLFLSEDVIQFDKEKLFKKISKANNKPLDECMKIMNQKDLEYAEQIIEKYIKKIISKSMNLGGIQTKK